MSASLRKFALYVLFPLAVALVFFLGAFFFFNRGEGYTPPTRVDVPFTQFTRTTVVGGAPRDFSDTPQVQLGGGILLVDGMHRNAFDQGEIITLLSRVTDRGYAVEFAGDLSVISEAERLSLLEDGLRGANSFLVIQPRVSYNGPEVELLEQFVEKGGKLLLVADPGRPHDINSLGNPFGLDFQSDFLFNQVENDLNFRNIVVRDFQPDELTQGLNEIALYVAGSVESPGPGLAATDANTQSSISETIKPFHPLARGNHRNVVAVFDLSFMIPPNNSILDNDRLVSNLADYLTDNQREFVLGDFPSFLGPATDILLGQPTLFDVGTGFKSQLAGLQIASQLRELEDLSRDTVFLGLYDNSPQVNRYLEAAGVQVGETLSIPSVSNIPVEGTSVILLDRSQDRHVLVVLGHTRETLADAIDRLSSGDFRTGLVDQFVGVYKTE